MSILSGLLNVAGFGAAPFTGGASLALSGVGGALDAFGKGGSVLGAQQGAAGNAMATQAQIGNQFDRNAIDSYGTHQDAQFKAGQQDLQRKQYETSSRSSAGKEALIAMLMGNHTPSKVSVAGVPDAQMSGGMGEALKNPQILELLKSIASKAQTDHATPMSFTGGSLLAPPKQTPLPQASKTDGILNTIARIAQIAGTAAPLFQKGGG